MIACIQGANKVDFLHDNQKLNGTSAPKAVGNVANSPNLVQNASANINNGPTDLLDVLFFGWTLHNDMTRCKKEEPEQYARYCYFFLCSLGAENLKETFADRPSAPKTGSRLMHCFFFVFLSFDAMQFTRQHTGYLPRFTATDLINIDVIVQQIQV